MSLISVYAHPELAIGILWDLLLERDPNQNISHKLMPTMAHHREFVMSMPYRHWYLVMHKKNAVGSIYLTHQNEIGVFIFKKHRGNGYGTKAIHQLMCMYPNERFLANINPNNKASIQCFTQLGFKHIQNTYALEDQP